MKLSNRRSSAYQTLKAKPLPKRLWEKRRLARELPKLVKRILFHAQNDVRDLRKLRGAHLSLQKHLPSDAQRPWETQKQARERWKKHREGKI